MVGEGPQVEGHKGLSTLLTMGINGLVTLVDVRCVMVCDS